ncbi:hypothetical protein R1sor_001541 [Riccia sorocarpa]|uniref:Uncharacterized protein n=1 Tax=Riccia sorocarpa TaxID=122646 RepID=A0ABD3GYW5_9MARC
MAHGLTRFGFKVLSEEEKIEQVRRQLQELVPPSPVEVEKQKKIMGRPWRVQVHQHAVALDQSMQMPDDEGVEEERDFEAIGALRSERGKRPKKYNNWFTPDLWPPIDAALKRYWKSSKAVMNHLQKFFGHKRRDNPYLRLNESTIRGWFKFNSKGVWQGRKELEIDFINLLNELMDASGQGDKTMMTVMVSSNAQGQMLPGQVIFKGSAESDYAEDGQAPANTANTANAVTDSQAEKVFNYADLFRR